MKWKTLEHNGILFPPPFESQGIKIKIKGEKIDIDFSDAYKIVDKEKDSREGMTKEAKKSLAAKRKKLREDMKEKYGKAIMDGKEVEVANYMAEPPGIFIGRGDHPIRGRWKARVTPKED